MPRGPLPNQQTRRTNTRPAAPTSLPAEGRTGPPPEPPEAYALGMAGAEWWHWAWATPQATQWDAGSLYFAVRRARLEDQMAALDFEDGIQLEDLLTGADEEATRRVEWALSMLKQAASGSAVLMREARELDNRLGLNPKAMAELRWSIALPAADDPADDSVTDLDGYRKRLSG